MDIYKADWKEAKSVTVASVVKGMQIYAPSETLKPSCVHEPYGFKGRFISTASLRRSRERETFGKGFMFEDFFRTSSARISFHLSGSGK